MKKLLLSFCLLFPLVDGFSQNWQCVQPGVQRYFLGNSLKGIRIDSVVSAGSDEILYPFRSPRGPYSTSFVPVIYLDMNGGSWLGKKIIVAPDGTNMLDTYWGDTVFIQTQAGINTSWTFYNDTSARYYTATVTGVDTMTILSVLDSVKTITVAAYNAQGLNPADMAHDQTIVFSKDHGLVKTFSLYVFPFHPPHLSSYTTMQDYLLDSVEVSGGSINSFTLIDYSSFAQDIFDFNVGDVFEWEGYYSMDPYWQLDSVLAKTIVSPTQVSYSISTTKVHSYPGGPNPYWTYSYGVSTTSPQITLIPDNKMPEETGTPWLVFYNPNDSSRCVKSPTYRTDPFIDGNGRLILCGESAIYKDGFGRIDYKHCVDPSSGAPGNRQEEMKFSFKNGFPCGNFYPLINDIKDEHKSADNIRVYPLPASDLLNIDYAGRYSYRLSDLVGKVVASGIASGKAKVPVQNLLSGVYTLYILDKTSNMRAVRKVLVQH